MTPTKPRSRFRDGEFLTKLGKHVHKLRKDAGLSMDALKLKCDGLSRATLSHLERGVIDPQIGTLKRISDALGIRMAELFEFN